MKRGLLSKRKRGGLSDEVKDSYAFLSEKSEGNDSHAEASRRFAIARVSIVDDFERKRVVRHRMGVLVASAKEIVKAVVRLTSVVLTLLVTRLSVSP